MTITWIRPDPSSTSKDTPDRVVISAVVEQPLVDKWLAHIEPKIVGYKMLVEPVNEWWFDIGGMCAVDEPEVSLDLDDWKLSMLAGHADCLHHACRRISTRRPDMGPLVHITAWQCHAILTVETAERIAKWLDDEVEGMLKAADDYWSNKLAETKRLREGAQ